ENISSFRDLISVKRCNHCSWTKASASFALGAYQSSPGRCGASETQAGRKSDDRSLQS
ncbi:hypothetical protein ATANTOWER_027963, partial [Ataeniobius toweri]|nr:hypothetical protein [Ataeniobius toweri]